jgi:hypothetical protein
MKEVKWERHVAYEGEMTDVQWENLKERDQEKTGTLKKG